MSVLHPVKNSLKELKRFSGGCHYSSAERWTAQTLPPASSSDWNPAVSEA
jgi:hypothetical protein